MTDFLVGLDAGHTVIKAVVFAADGREVGSGARPTATFSRYSRWQERDMKLTWTSAAGAITDALSNAHLSGSDVAAVAVGAHGDGLYLVDEQLQPVRAAILATDTRALDYCAKWSSGQTAERLLAVTGQIPAAYSPAATLSWLRDNEPESLAATRYLLYCKDWLRLNLTGVAATDPTDAAAGLFDGRHGQWSSEIIELCGLSGIERILPPVVPSQAVAGWVTVDAAVVTGLRVGTPVVTGCHDVDAAALGVGAISAGRLSAILGTFNINQLTAEEFVCGKGWQARRSVVDARYLLMSTSPAGTGAVDWVRSVAGPTGGLGDLAEQALSVAAKADDPLFLPFVYGTQLDPAIGGAFTGLGGWHDSMSLLRAAFEGVVFTHRTHLESLAEAGPLDRYPIRVTGGGSRSAAWTQQFADVTGLSVEVTDVVEAGARGAAMLASVGAGLYADLDQVAQSWVSVVRRQQPEAVVKPLLDERFQRWRRTAAALQSVG